MRKEICPPLPPCSRSQNYPREAQRRSDFLASVLLFLEGEEEDEEEPGKSKRRVSNYENNTNVSLSLSCGNPCKGKERTGREKNDG